jgi:hypothetical protein
MSLTCNRSWLPHSVAIGQSVTWDRLYYLWRSMSCSRRRQRAIRNISFVSLASWRVEHNQIRPANFQLKPSHFEAFSSVTEGQSFRWIAKFGGTTLYLYPDLLSKASWSLEVFRSTSFLAGSFVNELFRAFLFTCILVARDAWLQTCELGKCRIYPVAFLYLTRLESASMTGMQFLVETMSEMLLKVNYSFFTVGLKKLCHVSSHMKLINHDLLHSVKRNESKTYCQLCWRNRMKFGKKSSCRWCDSSVWCATWELTGFHRLLRCICIHRTLGRIVSAFSMVLTFRGFTAIVPFWNLWIEEHRDNAACLDCVTSWWACLP